MEKTNDKLIKDLQVKLDKSFDYFYSQASMIHGNTVNTGLIDSIKIDHEGQKVPISQLGFSSANQSTIGIHVYSLESIPSILSQLKKEGLSAYSSKNQIRVTVPQPSEDSREKNKKRVFALAEEAKVAMRKLRQEFRSRLQKEKLSEDQTEFIQKEIQRLLDVSCVRVDTYCQEKIKYL